jgi:hypothetical protein
MSAAAVTGKMPAAVTTRMAATSMAATAVATTTGSRRQGTCGHRRRAE